RLATLHALSQRWQGNKIRQMNPRQRQAERERALDYVRQNKGTSFGWAVLCLLQDQAGEEAAAHRTLAEAWRWFEDVPELSYGVRYEQARSLWRMGQREEAR